MATILEFRAGVSRADAVADGRRAASPAEIVFFPGVRYERWADEPEQEKPAKSRKRRDKLDIEE